MAADSVPKLPHNPNAERAVLGAILLDNAKLKDARGMLGPAGFFTAQHQRIFRQMLAMSEANQPIDLVTLGDSLERDGGLEVVGGLAYLSQLMDGMPRVANIEHYARIVKQKSDLRRLAQLGHAIEQAALAEDSSSAILRAKEALSQDSHESPARMSLVTAEEFLRRSSAEEKPWLAEDLLPAASQTIWQGRPKVGKSHSLLQLAFDLASGLPVCGHFEVKRAVRCAFFELEEPEVITKKRYADMLRAHEGRGPNAADLRFFTREDLYSFKILPRELFGARLKELISVLRDVGSEFVVFIASRRFLLTGENLKDPEVAERVNDALDAILAETGGAIALANHSRKQQADTVEAQGFGSTFIAARADATIELERARDGGQRRVRVEARFDAPAQFFLRKEALSDGELIRWCEAPTDQKQAKREELSRRVAQGETVHRVAKELGVPYSTAKRWVTGGEEATSDGSPAQ